MIAVLAPLPTLVVRQIPRLPKTPSPDNTCVMFFIRAMVANHVIKDVTCSSLVLGQLLVFPVQILKVLSNCVFI